MVHFKYYLAEFNIVTKRFNNFAHKFNILANRRMLFNFVALKQNNKMSQKETTLICASELLAGFIYITTTSDQ